jgi:ribosome-binding protein aMBF1 (putative translation factor)
MVVLPKGEYDELVHLANEALEDAADAAAYDAAMKDFSPEDILPVEVSAFITKGDNRVRAFRKWRGLSQQELSERAGLAQGFLSDLENRKRTLTEDVAAKLRKALDLPDNWLRT